MSDLTQPIQADADHRPIGKSAPGLIEKCSAPKFSHAKQILVWIANLLPEPHSQFEITFGAGSSDKPTGDG